VGTAAPGCPPGEARQFATTKFIRATCQLNTGTTLVPAFFAPLTSINLDPLAPQCLKKLEQPDSGAPCLRRRGAQPGYPPLLWERL
jgi:hypothetical protein